MEYWIILIFIVFSILGLKFIFQTKISEVKKLERREEVETLTDRFPDNIEIAKEMLKSLNNEKVKVEYNSDENSQTSLYIAITDKISIARMNNNYARIQTIAHECIHSMQDRRLLLFNFIFSNIYLTYFVVSIILIVFKTSKFPLIYLYVLTLMGFLQFSIRAYLEIDAMTKAKFLAGSYMREKKLLSNDETMRVLDSYEEINKIGIPFIILNLLNSHFIKFLICIVIIIIISL